MLLPCDRVRCIKYRIVRTRRDREICTIHPRVVAEGKVGKIPTDLLSRRRRCNTVVPKEVCVVQESAMKLIDEGRRKCGGETQRGRVGAEFVPSSRLGESRARKIGWDCSRIDPLGVVPRYIDSLLRGRLVVNSNRRKIAIVGIRDLPVELLKIWIAQIA